MKRSFLSDILAREEKLLSINSIIALFEGKIIIKW